MMRLRTIAVIAMVGATATRALGDPPPVTLGGYLETYLQWNLRDPSNGVTALRDFDDRHDSFALQNAELEGTWTHGAVSGRIALQAGDTPERYIAEPAFRHVQEAWAAWAAPARLELAAGLFLSPVGPEVVPVRDDWTWSRSDLFYALPAYHLGVRVKRALGDSGWSLYAMAVNGVNDVVDDNRGKSVIAAAAYAKDAWLAQVLYMGGPERPDPSPWRHTADAYVQGPLGGGVSFLVHADAGVEDGATWAGAAAYLRYDVRPQAWIAARADVVHDARAVLMPASTIGSGTATVAYRPADGLDLRLEYRHDHASRPLYFGGAVDAANTPNRADQDTITAGAVAWF